MQSTHVAHSPSSLPVSALLRSTQFQAGPPCVVALQPSFPTACDPAALQLGSNSPLNTACLAAAVKGTAPPPSQLETMQLGTLQPPMESKASLLLQLRIIMPGRGASHNTPLFSMPHSNVLQRVSSPSSRPSLCARRPLTTWELQLVQHRVPYRGRQGYCCLFTNGDGVSQPSAFDRCAAQFGVTDPGASAQAAAMAIN
ncbi:hypothetical protein B0H13DRAFT_1893931 [Mycena leptocephala]|nr:hypothetical protein B0H13DRAFT_1893931 [Mycena leptocephala]